MTECPDDHAPELRCVPEDAGLVLNDSGLWVDAGDNVGVLTSGRHVVIGWIEHTWCGPVPPPDRHLRDAVHVVAPVDPEHLRKLIDQASRAGVGKRRRCRYCRQTHPAGWMHEHNVCQGCAEIHLGVIH